MVKVVLVEGKVLIEGVEDLEEPELDEALKGDLEIEVV